MAASSSLASSSSSSLREWFSQVLVEKSIDESDLNYEMFGNYTQADVDGLKGEWFPESVIKRGKLQNVWEELQRNKGCHHHVSGFSWGLLNAIFCGGLAYAILLAYTKEEGGFGLQNSLVIVLLLQFIVEYMLSMMLKDCFQWLKEHILLYAFIIASVLSCLFWYIYGI